MLEKKINSPYACGIGRIFDGVSALLGICEKISTEAEQLKSLKKQHLKQKDFTK